MKQADILYIKPRDTYGASLLLSIFALFVLLMFMLYKINADTPVPEPQNNGFVVHPSSKQPIYLLTSKSSAILYAKKGNSTEIYTSKIKQFARFLETLGYKTRLIPEKEIAKLPQNAVLLVLDTPALTEKSKEAIKQFVQKGGNLLFNFTTGFTTPSGNYIGDRFVSDITGLHLSQRLGFASFKDNQNNGTLFVTPKLLSPFSTYLRNGPSLFVVLYDKVPIFNTPATMQADIVATSFSQATPPNATDLSKSMRQEESGMGWHGYYGKGKWVYLAFPSYAFYDNRSQKEQFKKLLAGIIDYLQKPVTAEIYPYIDRASTLFISEDTEYKFTNFRRFADLAKEYRIPVTAFIVAGLAQKPEHKEMMHYIAQNPYVEFASHSTSHQQIVGKDEPYIIQETEGSKKIIDRFAPKPIQGFRPPREELNDLMKKHLSKGGFTYILGATEEYLYPDFDKKYPRLLIIPRHGTDDYSYLVNLDWDQKQIVDQMIRELNFVTALNGIYTLSVHTHLFSYSSNINILRKFYNYLKEHPQFQPINGRQLVRRILQAKRLHQTLQEQNRRYILTIINDNPTAVENLYVKLFKHPAMHITGGGVLGTDTPVTIDNREDTIYIQKIAPNTTIKVIFTLQEG